MRRNEANQSADSPRSRIFIPLKSAGFRTGFTVENPYMILPYPGQQ